MNKAVQTVKGTHWGWYTGTLYFSSFYDLKATQMNMQRSLVQEILLFEFKLGHNAADIKIRVEWKVKVELITVTRWFKKFCWGCKNLNSQVRSGKPKTIDSEVVLQAIEANPMSSSWRVSGEFSKKLSDQARSRKPKTMDSEAKLPNSASYTIGLTRKFLRNF